MKKRLDPDFTVTAGEQENLIHAVLHARRVVTLHEGLRWQDIKRYGIEIAHTQGLNAPDSLKWNDLRRAIQIPATVISAGMQKNPRLDDSPSGPIQVYKGSCIIAGKENEE